MLKPYASGIVVVRGTCEGTELENCLFVSSADTVFVGSPPDTDHPRSIPVVPRSVRYNRLLRSLHFYSVGRRTSTSTHQSQRQYIVLVFIKRLGSTIQN